MKKIKIKKFFLFTRKRFGYDMISILLNLHVYKKVIEINVK